MPHLWHVCVWFFFFLSFLFSFQYSSNFSTKQSSLQFQNLGSTDRLTETQISISILLLPWIEAARQIRP